MELKGKKKISTIKPHVEDYLFAVKKGMVKPFRTHVSITDGLEGSYFFVFYQIIPRLFCNGLSLFRLTIPTICQFGFCAMIFIFSENICLLKWDDDICLFFIQIQIMDH